MVDYSFFFPKALLILLKFSSIDSEDDRLLRSRFIVSSKFVFVFILLFECKLFVIKALSFLILLFISSSDIVNVKLSNEPFNIESGLRDRVFCKNYNLSIVYFANVDDLWVCWYWETKVWSKDCYYKGGVLVKFYFFLFINFDDICKLSQSSILYSYYLKAMDSVIIILGLIIVLFYVPFFWKTLFLVDINGTD